jgi:acetyltransferase-like isoleucine patch superfamily enzyme
MPSEDSVMRGTDPLIQARARVRGFVKRLLTPAPRGLGKLGKNARVYRPWRIDGKQYIRIGDRSTVDRHSWLSALDHYAGVRYQPRLVLGTDVHIGRYACLTVIDGIVIEDGCLLSEHVYISDHAHSIDPEAGLLAQQKLVSKGPVRIGAHSLIGYRACILPGVELGKHCVVGANSVVTHSFADYSMVAGAPARLIKRYSLAERAWLPVKDAER